MVYVHNHLYLLANDIFKVLGYRSLLILLNGCINSAGECLHNFDYFLKCLLLLFLYFVSNIPITNVRHVSNDSEVLRYVQLKPSCLKINS